jgi:hypothetical protein
MVLGRRPDEFREQNQILHLIGAEVFDLITNIAIGGIGSKSKSRLTTATRSSRYSSDRGRRPSSRNPRPIPALAR